MNEKVNLKYTFWKGKKNVILIILYSYIFKKWCCNELRIPYTDPGTTLNDTKLAYKITYGDETFTLEGMYDVLFLPRDSSTNGVPVYLSGKYGEPIKSAELYLRGSYDFKTHSGLNTSAKTSKKYYISGTINRPDYDYIRKQNEKALTIHVEEHYYVDYSWWFS